MVIIAYYPTKTTPKDTKLSKKGKVVEYHASPESAFESFKRLVKEGVTVKMKHLANWNKTPTNEEIRLTGDYNVDTPITDATAPAATDANVLST